MELSLTPLFILPLVAGFMFIREWEATRYLVAREDGHKLYFRSAYWGLVIALGTFSVLSFFYLAKLETHWTQSAFQLEMYINFLDCSASQKVMLFTLLISPFSGQVLAKSLNYLTNELVYYYDALKENELELLLVEAMATEFMVMIILDDDKIYVGWVYKTSDPAKAERKYFSLIPVISGYRSEEKKTIFTTFYEEIYTECGDSLAHLHIEHFAIVLPSQRIMSARLFDAEAYARFENLETIARSEQSPESPIAA